MSDAVARRSILLPGILTLVTFFVLIGLGVWQVQRLAWKENLIRALDQRISADPMPLPAPHEWPNLTQDDWEFRRVTASVEFLERPHAYVYTPGSALRQDIRAPGYFVFAPARIPTGDVVVVDAGYVPDPGSHGLGAAKSEVTGYVRWPEGPRWFVSEHDLSGSVWHVRDHRLMAARLGWGKVAPFYIDQESPVPRGGLPRPGPLTVKLRNDHLGYAITWFGLAAALLVVFGFWAGSRAQRRT